MFWTIPTLMTWTRIVAIPLIVGVFYLPIDPVTRNEWATMMFVVFAATDWLDGFLARKLNQVSAFGAFLDPVADKILALTHRGLQIGCGRHGVFSVRGVDVDQGGAGRRVALDGHRVAGRPGHPADVDHRAHRPRPRLSGRAAGVHLSGRCVGPTFTTGRGRDAPSALRACS